MATFKLDTTLKNSFFKKEIQMNQMFRSWNPDTDGRPGELYRTYKNHKIATFSDRQGKKWKFAIDDDESEEFYPDRKKAMEAVVSFLDKGRNLQKEREQKIKEKKEVKNEISKEEPKKEEPKKEEPKKEEPKKPN